MTIKTWDQGTISFNVQDLENHESCVEKTAKLLFGFMPFLSKRTITKFGGSSISYFGLMLMHTVPETTGSLMFKINEKN